MDTLPEDDFERRVSAVLKDIPGILRLEAVFVHRFGPYLVMNITINVDGAISVAEGDQIASEAEKRLRNSIDFLQTVHIHYHPIQ